MDLENLEDLEKDTSEESEGEPVAKVRLIKRRRNCLNFSLPKLISLPPKLKSLLPRLRRPLSKPRRMEKLRRAICLRTQHRQSRRLVSVSSSARFLFQTRQVKFSRLHLFNFFCLDQLSQRKKLGTVHPFLTSARTHGKGLMLTFDSESSRNNAIKWFKSHQEPELRNLNIVKAEEDKCLQAEGKTLR
jgi:hypothetical protein